MRSNPLRAIFVLVRQADKGRRGKNADGKRSRSKKSQQAARSARAMAAGGLNALCR